MVSVEIYKWVEREKEREILSLRTKFWGLPGGPVAEAALSMPPMQKVQVLSPGWGTKILRARWHGQKQQQNPQSFEQIVLIYLQL